MQRSEPRLRNSQLSPPLSSHEVMGKQPISVMLGQSGKKWRDVQWCAQFITIIIITISQLFQSRSDAKTKEVLVSSTYIAFLWVLVRVQNTLEAAILLCQLVRLNVEWFFNAHYVEITAFCHWWLYNPALAEVSLNDIINVATTLPAFHRLFTTRMPALSQIYTYYNTAN